MPTAIQRAKNPKREAPNTKCTTTLVEEYLKILAEAQYHPNTVASLVGVTRRTVRSWREAGEDGRQPYADFLVRENRVLAEVERKLLQELKAASRWDKQDIWRKLESWFPENYGRRAAPKGATNVNVGVAVDAKPVKSNVTDDQFLDFLRCVGAVGGSIPLPAGEAQAADAASDDEVHQARAAAEAALVPGAAPS